MTIVQKDRLRDVATALVIFPFAVALSPIIVVVLWWQILVESWKDAQDRESRRLYLTKEVERQQKEAELRKLGA